LSRARNSLLAAAVADRGLAEEGTQRQPLLFEEARLSDDVWLALATCEAVARAGGRIGGAQAAAVLREWFDGRRFRNVSADGMKPLRDLAAGVPWLRTGSADNAARAAVVIRVAPLAFVLDLSNDADRAALDEVVRITSLDAGEEVAVMLAALRRCVHGEAVPDERALADSSARPTSVAAALRLAARHTDDLEGALRAAESTDDQRLVRVMTGFLLGAAGCVIPKHLLAALPERAELEAVIEPFAQLLTAVC
jgi:ADP-ribosylglycohydrolase